jgi:hypothetical protein
MPHGALMPHPQTALGRSPAGMAVAAALLLTACSDSLELSGKMFDVIGISSAVVDAKRAEPKLAERAPLVMPPDVNRLPEPGSGQPPPVAVAAAAQGAWPDDPEARKAREAKERERLHLAYCRGEAQWKKTALDKESVGAPRSPYGPCPSLLGDTITKNVNTE